MLFVFNILLDCLLIIDFKSSTSSKNEGSNESSSVLSWERGGGGGVKEVVQSKISCMFDKCVIKLVRLLRFYCAAQYRGSSVLFRLR